MENAQEQQEQQQSFNPTKILFIKLGIDGEGHDKYEKMLEVDFSESNFENLLKTVLSSGQDPASAKTPTRADTSGGLARTKLPILCNGYDTEVILYIPEDLGWFDTDTAPVSPLPPVPISAPPMIGSPRLFHLDNGSLQVFRKFSAANKPAKSQLAAFSYSGDTAIRLCRTNYVFRFEINARSSRPPFFPGSGDIGHPGGDYP